MRRIIERKLTIVTTTTWTISWHEDALHLDPEANPDTNGFPDAVLSQEKTVQHIQHFPLLIETKEVEAHGTQKVIDKTADQPPVVSYSYQSKKGNENP